MLAVLQKFFQIFHQFIKDFIELMIESGYS